MSTAIVPQGEQGLDLQEKQLKAKMAILQQKTPREEIKHRVGRGGQKYAYVEHAYVTELLNNAFGWNWDFEVLSDVVYEHEVVVRGRLTVRPSEGVVIVKEQFGGADVERYGDKTKDRNGNWVPNPKAGQPLSIADNLKAASSDALKKCASLLGIALDLYGRDYPEAPAENVPQEPLQVHDNPPEAQATREQVETILELVGTEKGKLEAVLGYYGVSGVRHLTEKQAKQAIARLQRKPVAKEQEVEA